MAGDGSGGGLGDPYLCRRFLRFLVWFKADLDIFRSLEETSSESEKRAERQGAEWGVRSTELGKIKKSKDPTFCSPCEPRGPVVATEALLGPGHYPHP